MNMKDQDMTPRFSLSVSTCLMKRWSLYTTLVSLLLALLLVSTRAWSLESDSTDATAIMNAVESRKTGDRVKSRLVMQIIDQDGRTRKRVVQSRSMDFAEGNKQLMIFESPEDVRNTGLLSIDYDAGDKDDDQWLYLPSLHKSTRISSGERSGSFMGTDLSFSDMTKSDPAHYTYKILKQSVAIKSNGKAEDCWLIESRPKTAKAKEETGYLKSHVWISKSKMMPLQVKSWVREGKKLKYIQFRKIKKVDNIWTAHQIVARTKKGKKVQSTTVLEFTEMKFNQTDIQEDIFVQSRLERGL
jgi:outer membrane lipoprotein-sorting protein